MLLAASAENKERPTAANTARVKTICISIRRISAMLVRFNNRPIFSCSGEMQESLALTHLRVIEDCHWQRFGPTIFQPKNIVRFSNRYYWISDHGISSFAEFGVLRRELMRDSLGATSFTRDASYWKWTYSGLE